MNIKYVSHLLAAVLLCCVSTSLSGDDTKADRKRFSIGKATTYVEGPLDANGRIDYAAAGNTLRAKGVTPQNNANVLFIQVIGPKPLGKKLSPDYYKLLGIEEPLEKGDYFVDFPDYLKAKTGSVAADVKKLKYHQRPWVSTDMPDLADWITAMKTPLDRLVDATRRSEYFNPLVPEQSEKGSAGLMSCPLPNVQAFRSLGDTLATRAMLRLGNGDAIGAHDDLMAVHRLGRHVARGGCLIELLVGISIEQTACRADFALLEHGQWDDAKLLAFSRELRYLPDMATTAQKCTLQERFTLLDVVMMIDTRGISALSGIAKENDDSKALSDLILKVVDWDPALENVNKWYDRMVSALQQKDRASRVKAMDQFTIDIRKMKAESTNTAGISKLILDGKPTGKEVGKSIGDVLISLLFPAATKVQDAEDRLIQIHANLQIAIHLARYKLAHGTYPKTLAVLEPQYAAKVPDDLFTNRPLVYKLQDGGYRLYSLGWNSRDDAGLGFDDVPRGDDIGIQMPAASK